MGGGGIIAELENSEASGRVQRRKDMARATQKRSKITFFWFSKAIVQNISILNTF